MLVPPIYAPQRTGDVLETVRCHPLALVCSNGAATPFATHAPVIIERLGESTEGSDEAGPTLAGGSLLGHINRFNDHWEAIEANPDGEVLVVFQGPQAYISPTAYEKRPAAPTWNFITVHVRGRIEALPEGQPVLDVVTATVSELEKVAGTGWDMTDSLDYFRKIQPGVRAFRVHVTSVEAMFKLSQEHAEHTRREIREHLAADGAGYAREVAEAMWAVEFAAGGGTAPEV
ncbi:FMN-binding negative transcriptional regulator [Kitasatospora sp. NBC_00315]|uniref:FMN-binding negative transcriptional regulator n=1 Tax=Kitasatospora sp. NBC_00315 TaxID=2975963 RepID=UPI003247D3A5